MSKIFHLQALISLKVLAFTLGLFVHTTIFGQHYNIDSLLTEFKYNPGVDLRTYDQLFMALYPEYMEELVLVAEDLLKRSVHEGNNNGMHRAADAFGLYFASKGHFNQAYKVLHRSMRFYERTENQAYLMKAYGYMGALFMAWDNSQQAVFWYSKLVSLSKLNTSENIHHSALNNLCLAYFSTNRFDLGLETLKKNSEFYELMNNENKAIYLNLFGNFYLEKFNIDSAKHYYQKSIEEALIHSGYRLVSTAMANLAICEFYQDSPSSLDLFKSSYEYALKSKSIERISVSLFNLASWHLENNNQERGLFYLNESYMAAVQHKSYRNIFDALDEIAEIYREQGNWHSVDSVNAIIRDFKTQQYQDFLSLTEDTELLESVFENDLSEQNKKVLNPSDIQFLNQTLLFSLIFFVIIQFVLILFLSTYLVRKRTKPL
jgi:hypothetical protein